LRCRISHPKLLNVKGLLPLVALLTIVVAFLQPTAVAQEKKRYVRYAEFIVDTEVELSDGSVWRMDKGDCFPIHMFKDQQTRVILKLDTASFSAPMYTVQMVPEREQKRAEAAYQKMVQTYLQSRARQLKAMQQQPKPQKSAKN
jgi:hypothetical protein